jgi:hypothetical protein
MVDTQLPIASREGFLELGDHLEDLFVFAVQVRHEHLVRGTTLQMSHVSF